jgi:hypothetical protein
MGILALILFLVGIVVLGLLEGALSAILSSLWGRFSKKKENVPEAAGERLDPAAERAMTRYLLTGALPPFLGACGIIVTLKFDWLEWLCFGAGAWWILFTCVYLCMPKLRGVLLEEGESPFKIIVVLILLSVCLLWMIFDSPFQ